MRPYGTVDGKTLRFDGDKPGPKTRGYVDVQLPPEYLAAMKAKNAECGGLLPVNEQIRRAVRAYNLDGLCTPIRSYASWADLRVGKVIQMPKIFLYCYPAPNWGVHDVIGYALAEDGTGLASHLSSNKGFSQHDMGLTSNWKHENYEKHYPEGFELEWVDDPDNHPGVAAAYALNKSAQHSVQLTDGGLPDSDGDSTPATIGN